MDAESFLVLQGQYLQNESAAVGGRRSEELQSHLVRGGARALRIVIVEPVQATDEVWVVGKFVVADTPEAAAERFGFTASSP